MECSALGPPARVLTSAMSHHAKTRRWAHGVGRRGFVFSRHAQGLAWFRGKPRTVLALQGGINDIAIGVETAAARERTRNAVNSWMRSAEAAGYFIVSDSDNPLLQVAR